MRGAKERGAPAADALRAMVSGEAPARSFPPLEGPVAHTLVLGTMPGTASLGAREYYAHPRNAFWPIMLSIVGDAPVDGAPPDARAWTALPYPTRVERLTAAGFAVWDVLAECVRPGSLDGRIVRASERPNDVAGLVRRHPELRRVAFNGRAARKLFARHVALAARPAETRHEGPDGGPGDGPALLALPSTSPAMASLTLEAKRAAWAAALLGEPSADERGRDGAGRP